MDIVCFELLTKALDEVIEVGALRVDAIDDPHQVEEYLFGKFVFANMLTMIFEVSLDNELPQNTHLVLLLLLDDGLVFCNDPLSDVLRSVVFHDVLDKVLCLVYFNMLSHLVREGRQLKYLCQLVVSLVRRVHHVLADLAEILSFQALFKWLFWEALTFLGR